MRKYLALMALALVAIGSACGGDDSSPAATSSSGGSPAATVGGSSPAATTGSSSGNIDACSLINKDEVQTTTGKQSKDPEPKAGINASNPGAAGTKMQSARCNFSAAGDGTLLVTVEWTKGKDTAANYESLHKLAGNAAEDVDGVADKAYLASGAITFLKGDSLVTVGATSAIADQAVAGRLRELAKKAAGRVK